MIDTTNTYQLEMEKAGCEESPKADGILALLGLVSTDCNVAALLSDDHYQKAVEIFVVAMHTMSLTSS
jgi:hypothetical protein